MIVYFDENLPRQLGKGFQEFIRPEQGIELRYLTDDFGRGAKDEDWIPKVGKLKGCVITQDFQIHRRKHEKELYLKYDLGIFFLRPPTRKKGISIWQMVEILARNWQDMEECIRREPRPFAYVVKGNKGLERIS